MLDETDWFDWHSRYADVDSPLAWRLRLVQRHIASWLDERTDQSLSVLSLCAGQGRDLLDVLVGRADAARVRARLIEYDPRNVEVARARAAAGNLGGVTVVRADAGDPVSYQGAVPADLVLVAGVLGNISDADVRATVETLPQLCAANATVIWTRVREAPDLTPAIRGWLADAGFVERAFEAPAGVLFSVGVHRFAGRPQPLTRTGKLFEFVR
jgi:hypothetical protein